MNNKQIFDDKFRPFWKNYIFQSLAATIVILFVDLLFQMTDLVIMASIGASVFIIFAMPNYPTARARNLIGGHSIALVIGALFGLIPEISFFATAIVDSFAVGLSIFLMVITETEHPPAAGTALGVVVTGISVDIVSAVLISTVLLSIVHILFRKFLRNLV